MTTVRRVAGAGEEVALWDLTLDQRWDIFPAKTGEWIDALTLAGSDDGKSVTAVDLYGTYWRWEVATGRVIAKGRLAAGTDSDRNSYYLSSNGRYAAVVVSPRVEPQTNGFAESIFRRLFQSRGRHKKGVQ